MAVLRRSRHAVVPGRPGRPRGQPLQPAGAVADLRLSRARASRRAATSTAASTTSTGSEQPFRLGHRLSAFPEETWQHLMISTTTVSSSSSAPAPAAARSATSWPRRASTSSSSKPGPARVPRLHQRRVGEFRPARLARHAHDVGLVARAQELPEPPRLDREGGWRLDHALGRRLAALPGARVQDADPLRAPPGCEPPGLADHARRPRAVLREGRGKDGCHPHGRPPRAAGQQQLQDPQGWRRQARLQGMPHRQHGHQFAGARRPQLLPADRLLLPGLQVGRQVVDALHRDPEGRGHRQAGGAARVPGAAHRA